MTSCNVEMIEDISHEMSLPELVEAIKHLADEVETVAMTENDLAIIDRLINCKETGYEG